MLLAWFKHDNPPTGRMLRTMAPLAISLDFG